MTYNLGVRERERERERGRERERVIRRDSDKEGEREGKKRIGNRQRLMVDIVIVPSENF